MLPKMSKLDYDPIPHTLSWPVRYIKKYINGTPSESVELKIEFSMSHVEASDSSDGSYRIELSKGHTVVGSGGYGGDYTECINYRAVGSFATVDLFTVIPLSDTKFTSPKKIKIVYPGPTKSDSVIITPQPLTIFKQFNFNSLSKRIHNTLQPIIL